MSTNIPSLRWIAFHAHKRGNAPGEYEDAFAGEAVTARFAVADGASESSFAATWAQLLVEGFLSAEGMPWRQLEWLTPWRARWSAEVDGQPLPWYAEEKREQGAYATLLGVVFRTSKTPEEPAVWRALAVGDSCLFRLRAGKLRQSFPLTRAADFGNRPDLLGSRGRPDDTPRQAIQYARGKCRPGDRFLLMTDALAEWMLRRGEEEQRPADDIERLLAEPHPHHAFAGWVEERRERQKLRNDDVTLVIIDL
jgi:serine/threonine protein phosphatase PrpC